MEDLLSCYDEHFYPGTKERKNERRRITIQIVGTSEEASGGRPVIESAKVDEEVDKMIASFHKTAGGAVWN